MRNVGQVAQLVEQLTLNQLVKGSSPFLPTFFLIALSKLIDII